MKRTMKIMLSMALVLTLAASLLAGCAPSEPTTTTAEPTTTAEEPTTADTTAPAASTEKVVLAVSFGTSYDETREKTIGAVEKALQTAFPEYEVRRAFTSNIIKDILAERDIMVDDVKEAMDRLVSDGVKDVIIQPLHVMNGFEYDDAIEEITPYQDKFDSFKVGQPLLIADEDYAAVADALVDDNASYAADDTALVFMGHGTEHASNATYAKLQSVLTEKGYENIFIGTVEAEPSLEDMIEMVKETSAKKVVLLPLMVVAGDHATNDMAGDEEDSWKSEFTAAGFEVEAVLKGLGEYKAIQDIYVQHAKDAVTP